MPLFIDKEYILSNIPQAQIFTKYGVPYQQGLFKSPLRKDLHPTCSFHTRDNGKLIMRDFSGHFWGDCFDLVKKVHGVQYGEALQIIGNDFGLSDGVTKTPKIPIIIPEKQKVQIRVKRREWSKATSKFWKEYGITKNTIDVFKTSPAEMIWLNGVPVYKYHPSQPAYIYHWNDYNYQIYFPFASSGKPRFLVSNGAMIHGFEQLPLQGDLCVITKARKDVMCFYEFETPSVASIAESVILSANIIGILKSRFKRVVSLMDYDNTGIHTAWVMRKLYDIEPFFFSEGAWMRKRGYRGAKDLSDFRKIHKVEKTRKLISYVKRINGVSTAAT